MFKIIRRKNAVEISPSIVVFAVSLLLLLYFIFLIRSIIILLFMSFIIMVALNPLVRRMEGKLRFPRLLSIVIAYVLLFIAISSVLALLVPPLATELYGFVKTFQLPWLQDQLSNFTLNLNEVGNLIDRFGSSANTLYSIVSSTFSGVFTVFTIMVMSFYLMLDRRNLHLRIAWFTQRKEHLEQAKDFIDSLEYQLGGWVRGQIILMLVIGILTYIGLLLLGLPYALPLALLAASLEILPNLGPTLAAVPAVVIAYITAGPLMGLFTLLFYILVQQFENNLLVPKIMKDNVDVSPLISIVSILIGLKLAGVIGALLAIPIYIILRTIYSTWVKDHLID